MQAVIHSGLIGLVDAPFAAAYPGIPLVHNNVGFDRNNPPATWVEYEIKFAGGSQVGMNAAPKTRTHGWLYVTVWCKEGSGWKVSNDLIDWFTNVLKYASISGVNLQAPQPETIDPPPGWYTEQLKLYFYSDPM